MVSFRIASNLSVLLLLSSLCFAICVISAERDRFPLDASSNHSLPLTASTLSTETTVYVSSTLGSDSSGNGSFAKPWRTIRHAMVFAADIVIIDEVTDFNVDVSSNLSISGLWTNATWNCQQNGYAVNVSSAVQSEDVIVMIEAVTFTQCSNGALQASGAQTMVRLANTHLSRIGVY